MKRLGIQPPIQPPSPQPRTVRFGIKHIPQHLLPEWHAEHLARFTTTVKPRLLRRAAAARLAQICLGGHPAEASQQLGIPRQATINALTVVHQRLPARSRREFDTAVDALADHLNTTSPLTDYGRRRQALTNWAIPTEEWNQLTADLRAQTSHRASRWPGRPYIDWHDNKRILASTWVWVRITHGEHIFAPAIRPDPNQRRPGGNAIRQIHNRWPLISADQPTGHYAALRERLDTYADQLTADIDHQ